MGINKRVPQLTSAFVTFSTDMGRRVVYKRYGSGSRCHRLCCQGKALRYHGLAAAGSAESHLMTRVALKKAPEPSTMLWQNLSFNVRQRLCRRLISFLVATSVIVAAAVGVYYARTSDPSALGQECLGDGAGTNSTNATRSAQSVVILGQTLSCDSWIREVARTSDYGDLSVACAPYIDTITEANLWKTNATSLARTCGCHSLAFTALRSNRRDIVDLCESYLQFVFINTGLQTVAVLSVIIVNIVFVVVAKKLGKCEAHHSLDGMESSVAFRVLIGLFLNTGLVLLIVNARADDSSAISDVINTAEEGGIDLTSVLQGKYPDFTANWYSDVGVAITITMLIYVFSPHMPPLLRFCRFSCKNKHSATQAGLNALYMGPDFHHSIRYPQISVVVFVSMVYSSGIPILYLVIAATAFTFYWTDKYLFTRWYRTPPQYDAQISLQFSGYLPYAALLHVVFGSWMLANRRMFSSPSLADDSNSASNNGDSLFHQQLVQYIGDPGEQRYNIISCLLQDHMGPMVTALVVLLGYLIFFELIWHVVGPPL